MNTTIAIKKYLFWRMIGKVAWTIMRFSGVLFLIDTFFSFPVHKFDIEIHKALITIFSASMLVVIYSILSAAIAGSYLTEDKVKEITQQ